MFIALDFANTHKFLVYTHTISLIKRLQHRPPIENLYNKRQCPRQQNNQQQQLFFGSEFFTENFLNGIFLIKSFLPKSSLASQGQGQDRVRLVKGNFFKILKIPRNAGYNSQYLNINYISILFPQRSELSHKRNFKDERKIIQANDF